MTESESSAYIVGIDQTLVDIEAKVDEAFINRYNLSQDTLWLLKMMYEVFIAN